MKYYFKTFLFIVFFSLPTLSENLVGKYSIKTKGILIGNLVWKLNLNESYYKTALTLRSKGFLSGLYHFSGEYKSDGIIINKNFIPESYSQNWKTKKQEKKVKIFFANKKIKDLILFPEEKEIHRINYKKIENYVDPLTSFINILINNKSQYTVDGRRTYLMFIEKQKLKKIILIKEYKNIWADHKRNDLEYLEIIETGNEIFPKQINIKFKGSIFSLIKS